ncbi:hypothetical protein [Micromonospora sp. WMMD975]|uniref:hypothetical protein n=1 Tax=Micromonospora sp. WMMD975 TaxID=3016087 RepID=UPI00249AD6BE|nr:hypothetical protein [Micromonospora sp. WMMD975]WFE36496.1 hypothetical protein O7613_14205 [Micromonospora sp. WMMD975]
MTVDLDRETAEELTKAVDELTDVVTRTARMICAEQPDVPEPGSLQDMDSFSMVQMLLELENGLDMKLLEKMEGFRGESFRDLARFIVRVRGEEQAADSAGEEQAADSAGAAQATDRAGAAQAGSADGPAPA